ncbi:hypothetical protein CASFOL_034700 [Castilleja foliolosa]|uniref:60S ribosomal protein L2, mitochondrial n=1 Tax=Castilleja foliolosa TaxID=1961234 RepID=A0ABD3BRD8_9LAMI
MGSVLTDKVINRSKGLGYATIARENKPLKQLTSSNGGRSAGRNSSGRITIFHRGGGAKRLHRKIDLKRSTSSMGVVERIEYNPNRSTRIALVRWKGGAQQRKPDTAQDLAPPSKRTLEVTAIMWPIPVLFPSGKVADQAKVACSSPGQVGTYVMVCPNPKTHSLLKSSKKTSTKDVLSSAFSNDSSSIGSPRISVAGAKPNFFVFRKKENAGGEKHNTFSLGEIQKWRTDSVMWAHRMGRELEITLWPEKGHLIGDDVIPGHIVAITSTTVTEHNGQLLRSAIGIRKLLHLTLKNDGKIVVNNVSEIASDTSNQSTSNVPGTSAFTPTTPIPKSAASKRQIEDSPGSAG